MSEEEMAFSDYRPDQFLSFKEQKTQQVIFDPKVKVVLKKGGQFGDAWCVPVDQGGQIYWLRLKSKRLKSALDKVKARSKIEITQSGSGFDTTYAVKVLGPSK